MFLRTLTFLFLMTSFPSACIGGPIVTPADYFYEKNPELKNNYVALYPTSYENIIRTVHEKYNDKIYLIRTLLEKFPDLPALTEYLRKTEQIETENYNSTKAALEDLKRSLSKNDYFYYFDYQDNKIEESGLLILNGGNIRWKEVHVRTFKATEDEK